MSTIIATLHLFTNLANCRPTLCAAGTSLLHPASLPDSLRGNAPPIDLRPLAPLATGAFTRPKAAVFPRKDAHVWIVTWFRVCFFAVEKWVFPPMKLVLPSLGQ